MNTKFIVDQLNNELEQTEQTVSINLYDAKETYRSWTSEHGSVMLIPAITYIGKNQNSERIEPYLIDVPVDEDMLSSELEE
ncbi:MAG: hypothetical protein JXR53_01635 [Bacteroidales bacterium]|nr:hypothetical protein [Bacteroidales bacterium]